MQALRTAIITGIVIASIFAGAVALSENKKQKNKAVTGETAKRLPCFLAISDVHMDTSKSATRYLSETGIDLWTSAKQKINKIISTDKPTFIIVLGDLPWHANRNDISQLKNARGNTGFVLENLRGIAVAAKIPLLYVTGNNDSWGGDYDAFTVDGKTPFMLDVAGQDKWPMINSSSSHGTTAPSIADSSILQLGCYSAYPLGRKSHLRVIALNSVIFVNDKVYSGNAVNDAGTELGWLKEQLSDAEKLNDMVLIAMHVQPGKSAYLNTLHGGKGFGKNMWDSTLMYKGNTVQDAFLDMADQYKTRIIGVLGSHTHMDGVKILLNRCKQFSNILISVPSIAPDHLNNPGIKVISYDPSNNYALMNFTTSYYTFNKDAKDAWETSYSFDSVFNCAAGTSISAYIQSAVFDKKDIDGFLKNNRSIYMVKSIMPNDNDMQTATKADYQKELCTP